MLKRGGSTERRLKIKGFRAKGFDVLSTWLDSILGVGHKLRMFAWVSDGLFEGAFYGRTEICEMFELGITIYDNFLDLQFVVFFL